jgi:Ca2+-binding RTX toxin-like protein
MPAPLHLPSRLLAPACALAVLAILPGAAHAASITGGPGSTYTYVGAPGEVNNVGVQGAEDGSVTFYGPDAIKVGSAPASCTPSDLYGWSVVTCASATGVVVQAGDGDEVLSVSSTVPASIPVTIDGGPGRDIIEGDAARDTLLGGAGDDKVDGGKGDDALDGGDGNDEVVGGAGGDHLSGGAGDDTLTPDSHEDPSADVVDGGPGVDTVTGDYSSRFRPSGSGPQVLSFTLGGGADDGRPGEGDDVHGIERLIVSDGGRFAGTEGPDYVKLAQVGSPGTLAGLGGDDDLNGGDGTDTLDGGAGDDHLDGGFGDDVITGGPGRDRISGDLAAGDCGPLWCKYPYGNDTINAQDGEIDTIVCGFGTDVVNADAIDVVDHDCETVNRAGAAPAPAPVVTAGPAKGKARVALAARVKLAQALKSGFAVKVTGAPAGGTLKLSATRAGRVVARGSGKATKSGTATITLRFTAKARRSLRHAKTLKLKVAGGGVSTTITLKRR